MFINLFHKGQMKNVEIDEDLIKDIPQTSPLLIKGEFTGVIGKIVKENDNITAIIGDDYLHFFENFANYNISKIKDGSDEKGIIFVLT